MFWMYMILFVIGFAALVIIKRHIERISNKHIESCLVCLGRDNKPDEWPCLGCEGLSNYSPGTFKGYIEEGIRGSWYKCCHSCNDGNVPWCNDPCRVCYLHNHWTPADPKEYEQFGT